MGVPSANQKKRWPSLLPLFVALVVVLEIAFLGRLDMAKNAAMVHQWTTSFYFPSTPTTAASAATNSSTSSSSPTEFLDDDYRHCQDWLEKEDAVPYSRDFRKDPIIVSGIEQLVIL
ncbi:putative fucosyltransferase-like protein [Cocos nucifera]|nr:putative fucosyltransferase-like protein [Cocos nucifera]